MKQTRIEARISKCRKIGRRHKWLRPPMVLEILFLMGLNYMLNYITQNKKRLAGTGLAVLAFFAVSSFSLPVPQNQPESETVQAIQPEEQQPENAVLEQGQPTDKAEETDFAGTEKTVSDEPKEAISTEELNPDNQEELLLTETAENEHSGKDAQYSADEILGNSHSQELLNRNNKVTDRDGFSKDDWNLILVNKQHPVPEDYTFEMGTITAAMKCDARILPELFAMLQAAKEDGVNLRVCSPYRDISLQNVLFERKIKLYMGQGDSYLEAYKKASQIVTVPGASEHQIGLALDIISDSYTDLDEGFGKTAAGKWLRENSKEYGFILRYPEGKEHITGIGYEPWHFRYVGKEAAVIIMNQGLTLEEFVESISE